MFDNPLSALDCAAMVYVIACAQEYADTQMAQLFLLLKRILMD